MLFFNVILNDSLGPDSALQGVRILIDFALTFLLPHSFPRPSIATDGNRRI